MTKRNQFIKTLLCAKKTIQNYNQFFITLLFLHIFLSLGSNTVSGKYSGNNALQSAEAIKNKCTVNPLPYENALRNPMKGFTTRGVYDHPWATLAQTYIGWNELENDKTDGIEKIRQVCNEKWAGLPEKNVKVIPRVYLHWSGDKKYWPADMQNDDYSSEQFQERVLRLVERLGACWNNDPRIAFIELGIFGKWGEHHSPDPTPEMQKLVGEAVIKAFPDKKVAVRQAWAKFDGYGFGQYWDSWAHYDQMYSQGTKIKDLVKDGLYLKNYIGGEAAYDWGNSNLQPGSNPTASVGLKKHRDFVIHTLRWLHCTQLRWIENYDQDNEEAVKGADEIQKAFGYRYELNEVRFSLNKNKLIVSFDVTNTGSAPFYYNWPVEVSLLDPGSLEPVWKSTFETVDIRNWLPGENWTEPEFTKSRENWSKYTPHLNWTESGKAEWGIPPVLNSESGEFVVKAKKGKYILALAVLDPAGMLPSLRFATRNYLKSGRHPLGIVDLKTNECLPLPDDFKYDSPADDKPLHYLLEGE